MVTIPTLHFLQPHIHSSTHLRPHRVTAGRLWSASSLQPMAHSSTSAERVPLARWAMEKRVWTSTNVSRILAFPARPAPISHPPPSDTHAENVGSRVDSRALLTHPFCRSHRFHRKRHGLCGLQCLRCGHLLCRSTVQRPPGTQPSGRVLCLSKRADRQRVGTNRVCRDQWMC